MRTLVIVHGALMVAAFVLLMPTGVLMARHRCVVCVGWVGRGRGGVCVCDRGAVGHSH